jgi:branched-subunit amino acid aminotransferase/4-amino-4-deoxychorismate lyase
MEAVENDCFDAVLLNEEGFVCETSSTNIFWISDNILYTPDENCGVLLGTIRQKILSLSPLRIVTIQAKMEQLLNADEVFLTNTALGILSVDQIMDKKFLQKKYAEIFKDLLNCDIKNYVSLAKSA